MAESNEERWLLLIHQLPPKPHYFRVKIWRRLQRLGAVAIKNSVYVLPKNDQTQEDFQWVLREITEVAEEARRLVELPLPEGPIEDGRRTQSEIDLARLKRRLAEVVAIDFFGAPGRETVEAIIL